MALPAISAIAVATASTGEDGLMARMAILVTAAAAMLLLSGCLRPRVFITSTPAGAEIYVNDEPRGTTPVEMPFTWYWYYRVRAEKEGYQTTETLERLRAPWWATAPFELLVEAMPFPVYDSRYRHYNLQPAPMASTPATP
jgi:hypothetical protein